MDTALANIEAGLAMIIPALAEIHAAGRSGPILSFVAAKLRAVVGNAADAALCHERVKAHRATPSARAALGLPG